MGAPRREDRCCTRPGLRRARGSRSPSSPPPAPSLRRRPLAPSLGVSPGSWSRRCRTPSSSSTSAQAPAVAPVAAINGAGDVAAGRLVFRKCQACHSMDPGKNMLGPSLAGIIGRKAGAEAGYNYSPAIKQSGFVWDANTLDAYLAAEQGSLPHSARASAWRIRRRDAARHSADTRRPHPRRPVLPAGDRLVTRPTDHEVRDGPLPEWPEPAVRESRHRRGGCAAASFRAAGNRIVRVTAGRELTFESDVAA